jgi:spore coat protein U-like protein
MTSKRTIVALLIAAGSMAAATAARAGTVGARMDVTATVVVNCRLIVPPLAFGTYDPLAANAAQPADASAVVSVTCTRNTTAALSFDFGLHAASTSNRGMTGPGPETLQYQIYRDSARSQLWGSGGDAMQLLSKGIAQPQQFTVFGRIPPQQEIEPGAYSDVLTAAVDF